MFKSFRFSLFEWALAATAFYCGAVFSGVHENWTTFLGLRPNEVGDFLAGVFGPLAFLWLVFGYYQQGEELKHSVEALKLQAEELRNSVEQQKELVEVSREAIQAERSEKELQAQRRLKEIKPRLTIETKTPQSLIYSYSISNSGGDCRDLTINLFWSGEYQKTHQIENLAKGHSEPIFSLHSSNSFNHFIKMEYFDIDGNRYEKSHRFT